MPVRIKKLPGKRCVRVSTPHGVKSKCTTPAKAAAQKRLLNAVDHGWKPTHEGRDDLAKLPLPPAAKRYARMSGPFATGPGKVKLFRHVNAMLTNSGKQDRFRNYDGHPAPVPRAMKEAVDKLVSDLLDDSW